MANICENTLRVYSENPENIEYVKDFFEDWGDIEEVDNNNLTIYFNSKWGFPIDEMNKLYLHLPNKDNIDMLCLSVEWGNKYCCFSSCTRTGWHYEE